MRLLAVLAAALALAASAAADPPPFDRASAGLAGPPPAAASAGRVTAEGELERLLLEEINRARSRYGVSGLRPNRALAATAREHSRAMAVDGFFQHASRDGTPFWKRLEARYAPVRTGYWSVGENLAWGSPRLGAARIVELWLESPPHRKNLLGATWREVGIGGVLALGAPGVYAGLDVTIVTVDFGARG